MRLFGDSMSAGEGGVGLGVGGGRRFFFGFSLVRNYYDYTKTGLRHTTFIDSSPVYWITSDSKASGFDTSFL